MNHRVEKERQGGATDGPAVTVAAGAPHQNPPI